MKYLFLSLLFLSNISFAGTKLEILPAKTAHRTVSDSCNRMFVIDVQEKIRLAIGMELLSATVRYCADDATVDTVTKELISLGYFVDITRGSSPYLEILW